MLPGACRIVGYEYLHAMSVDIGEYIELSLMIANTWSPYPLPIGFFAVGKPEFISHIQSVECITKELPVNEIFRVQYDQSGHTVHGGTCHVEVFSYANDVRVREFIVE